LQIKSTATLWLSVAIWYEIHEKNKVTFNVQRYVDTDGSTLDEHFH